MVKIESQSGFTLIELVVVIVILGILAVTAAPKFIDLQGDAHTANLKAVKAAMESAGALVYGKSLVKGNNREPFSNTNTVDLNDGGALLKIHYGHPTNNPADWQRLIDINGDDFTTLVIGAGFYVYPTGKTAPTAKTDACIAYYIAVVNVGEKPEIAVNPC